MKIGFIGRKKCILLGVTEDIWQNKLFSISVKPGDLKKNIEI